MMLGGLGGRISHALQEMNNLTAAAAVDVNVLGECVDEMSRVLFRADVRFKMVRTILSIIKKLVAELSTGHYKWRVIRQAFFLELCNKLDPAELAFIPEKGKLKDVISAGLQGSGIISNRTTFADHHRKKGWTPATVPADFFKTRASDQLKLKASKAKIPFYGSYTGKDAENLVQEVADKFKEENLDLVLVDATVCHEQEILLFEENREAAELPGPDLVRFSMGPRTGEAVFDEGQVFKLSNVVRSFISTNMEGPAKGGSALTHVLSAANTVTATAPHQSLQSPANQVDETLKQDAVCKESLKDDTYPVKGHRRGRNETDDWMLSAAKGKEQDDDDEDDDDDDDEDNDDDDYEEEEDDDNDNKLEAGDDEEDVEGDEEEADDDAGEDGEGEDEADDNGQDDDGEEDGEDDEDEDVEGDEDGEEEPEEEEDEDGEQDPEEEDDDEAEGESEEDVEDLEPPKKKRK